LSAGLAVLSAQKPDRARSVLLQQTFGPCAVPPVPAFTVLCKVAQRFREWFSALASALHLEELRVRIRSVLPDWPRNCLLRSQTREAHEQPVAEPVRIPPNLERQPNPIASLAEFEEEELDNDVDSYWIPHAPTKGGKIMTGSA